MSCIDSRASLNLESCGMGMGWDGMGGHTSLISWTCHLVILCLWHLIQRLKLSGCSSMVYVKHMSPFTLKCELRARTFAFFFPPRSLTI